LGLYKSRYRITENGQGSGKELGSVLCEIGAKVVCWTCTEEFNRAFKMLTRRPELSCSEPNVTQRQMGSCKYLRNLGLLGHSKHSLAQFARQSEITTIGAKVR